MWLKCFSFRWESKVNIQRKLKTTIHNVKYINILMICVFQTNQSLRRARLLQPQKRAWNSLTVGLRPFGLQPANWEARKATCQGNKAIIGKIWLWYGFRLINISATTTINTVLVISITHWIKMYHSLKWIECVESYAISTIKWKKTSRLYGDSLILGRRRIKLHSEHKSHFRVLTLCFLFTSVADTHVEEAR